MRKSFSWGIFFAFLVITMDLISKSYVYREIPLITHSSWHYPYGGIGIFQNFLGVSFSIVHATNKGAAWGSLSDFQIPLLILRIGLVAGLLGYLIFFNKNRKYIVPFCLLIAGAFGNVIDYFLYGVVIDMFKFVLWGYHYPIFNIADSAITIGIGWMIVASFFQHDTCTELK